MQINIKNIVLFCSFIIFSQQLFAIQLGDIKVNSTQDQKLNASIKLTLSSDETVDDLRPSVASQEAYISRSIDRFDIHGDIKMSIKKTPKGAVLLLSSNLLVKDPFIDLLIQIDSPKGRNYAEYTVLLDPPPPGQKIKKEESKPAPKAVKEPATKAVKEPAPKAVKEPAPKAVKRKNVKSKAGQTLYQIARNNKSSKVTVEQMVIAIFQSNPKAFAKNNVNGLLVGQNLKLPLEKYFDSLSHFDARKILREQNKEWKLLNKKPVPKKINTSKKLDDNKIKLLEQELAETKKLLEKTKQPKLKQPEVKQPEVKQPEVKQPEVKQPEVIPENLKQKEVREPKLDQPETFKSSITDPKDDVINEVVIKDEEKKSELSTLHMFLLVGLLVSLIGLLVTLSRRRKAKQNFNSDLHVNSNPNKEEDLDILSSLQSGRDFVNSSDVDENTNNDVSAETQPYKERGSSSKEEDKP